MKFKTRLAAVWFLFSAVCISCGPETILLRPSLDTPARHVENGYKLMAYGKVDPAVQEFMRAKELSPSYAPAYVGLGIALGMKGDIEAGRTLMTQARKLARNTEERKEVEMGLERLDYMEQEKQP